MATANDNPDDAANGDEPLSDEEKAELDRPLNELLGIEFDFAPDELAPPVDKERLKQFVQGTLTDYDKEEILDMISTFRPWVEALREVLLQIKPPKRRP